MLIRNLNDREIEKQRKYIFRREREITVNERERKREKKYS